MKVRYKYKRGIIEIIKNRDRITINYYNARIPLYEFLALLFLVLGSYLCITLELYPLILLVLFIYGHVYRDKNLIAKRAEWFNGVENWCDIEILPDDKETGEVEVTPIQRLILVYGTKKDISSLVNSDVKVKFNDLKAEEEYDHTFEKKYYTIAGIGIDDGIIPLVPKIDRADAKYRADYVASLEYVFANIIDKRAKIHGLAPKGTRYLIQVNNSGD